MDICKFRIKHALLFFLIFNVCFTAFDAHTQENTDDRGSVEVNGDIVEFDRKAQEVVAKGNVEVRQGDTVIFCDEVHFSQEKNVAFAVGNVLLQSPRGEVAGDEITFDFTTRQGTFFGARLMAHPYFGKGEVVQFNPDNTIEVHNGWVTTSDYDKPEYRIQSKKIEVFPGNKLVARHITMRIGDFPLLYLPFFKHRLDDYQPKLLLTPGYDNDWGAFLLSQYRFYTGEKAKGIFRLDYRELRGVAGGLDIDYQSDAFGSGILKLYYADDDDVPTGVRPERWKGEWRHKWVIDETTTAVWQYYRLSDRTFLKDFFEQEFDEDSFPDSFFVISKNLKYGVVSARADVRVNNFVSEVERLPELKYDLPNTEIGDTGFYFKNVTTLTSLVKEDAAPTDVEIRTQRGDTDYEISYPTKIGFLEFKPFAGAQHTYYSRKIDTSQDEVRHIFRGGATMSTRFFKTYDTKTNIWGLDINRIRHIITPSILYEYTTEPTIENNELNQFDNVDSSARVHNINFQLENKLQTKRDGKTVELLRMIFGVDYRLKEDARDSGFDQATADIDFRPTNWLTFFFDARYDTQLRSLETANFDIYFNPSDRWNFGLGKRYDRDVDDQLTANFFYRFNPKWKVSTFVRYDIESGEVKEQDYKLTRDLHAWELDMKVNDTVGDGTEVLLLFRLKAFPGIGGLDFGTTFERQRSGSENLDN